MIRGTGGTLALAGWLLLLGGAGPLGAPDPAPESPPIRIGVTCALTGPLATEVAELQQGIDLAVAQLNRRGGVLGRRLEIVYADTRSDIANVSGTIRALVEERKVSLIIGDLFSAFALAGAEECQRRRVLMITPVATNPAVTRVGSFIFRTCFQDNFQGKALAAFARKGLEADRAAILTEAGSEYSTGLADAFAKEFERLGGAVAAREAYRPEAEGLTGPLETIRTSGATVCLLPGRGKPVGQIARGLEGTGITLLGGDSWNSGSDRMYAEGGTALDGAYYSSHYALAYDSPGNKAFRAGFRARYGKPDPARVSVAALAYDTVHLLAAAIRQADSTEARAVRNTLGRLKNFQGATGRMWLDSRGDMIKSVFLYQIRGTQPQFVQEIEP